MRPEEEAAFPLESQSRSRRLSLGGSHRGTGEERVSLDLGEVIE